MPEQLSLRYNTGYTNRERWEDLLELLQSVVATVGLKEVAYALDVQPSALSHALAERDRHYARMEWLPYLVEHAPSDTVVELIASWRGLEVKPRETMTPEKKLARLETAISDQLGPEIAAILRKAAGFAS